MTEQPIQRLVAAIKAGDQTAIESILADDPSVVHQRIDDNPRSMLHYATDWPGHFPQVGETIQRLLAAGADPNVGAPHPHDDAVAETPLHWAASSDDVIAAELLLQAGADADAPGGIFGGCTPFEEAIIFQKFGVARLLLDHGATNYLAGAAALGQVEQVESYFDASGTLDLEATRWPHREALPDPQDVLDRGFQFACRSGHRSIAEFLLDKGADPMAISPGDTSALDMATDNNHHDVVRWLEELAG